MEARQVPVVLALAACVGMLVTVPVVGVGTGGGQSLQVDNTSSETTATGEANGSFGGQISAFMQTSAVDANSTVESGMFTAAVDDSESPERELTAQADRLTRELEQLERKATRLQEYRDNGTMPDVAYTAQASAVRERIANLRGQIDGTETTAERVGVDLSALDRIRTRAANLTGPEVSALARTITDAPRGPPTSVPDGPPGDTGPSKAESGPPGEAEPAENELGPPENESMPSENESIPSENKSMPSESEPGPPENESRPPENEPGPPNDKDPSSNVTGPPDAVDPPGTSSRTPTGDGSPEATEPGNRTGSTGPPEAPVGQHGTETGSPDGTEGGPGTDGQRDGPQNDRRQGNPQDGDQRGKPTGRDPPSNAGPQAIAAGSVGTDAL